MFSKTAVHSFVSSEVLIYHISKNNNYIFFSKLCVISILRFKKFVKENFNANERVATKTQKIVAFDKIVLKL